MTSNTNPQPRSTPYDGKIARYQRHYDALPAGLQRTRVKNDIMAQKLFRAGWLDCLESMQPTLDALDALVEEADTIYENLRHGLLAAAESLTPRLATALATARKARNHD